MLDAGSAHPVQISDDPRADRPAALIVAAKALAVWGFFRLCYSIAALSFSSQKPLLEIETTVTAWPPAAPLPTWLERALIAPWQRWDVTWYEQILTQGYRAGNGTAQFHPLYIWLAVPLERAGLHPVLSLLIVSAAALVLLLVFYERLVRDRLAPADIPFLFILTLAFPASFILFAPYTEGLFLLFAVLLFYYSSRHQWWLAGAAGGLAVLTRQQGLFLILPLAWELWEYSGKRWQGIARSWRQWLCLGLIPAGMVLWLIYRGLAIQDVHADFSSLHSFIYSFLISSSAEHVVDVQAFLWPWQALGIALQQVWFAPDVDLVSNLAGASFFLLLLGISWSKLSTSERIYVAAITLISFSYYTGPVHPYMGLLRHLLLAFPVFTGVAARVKSPKLRMALVTLSFAGSIWFLMLYVAHAWVP